VAVAVLVVAAARVEEGEAAAVQALLCSPSTVPSQWTTACFKAVQRESAGWAATEAGQDGAAFANGSSPGCPGGTGGYGGGGGGGGGGAGGTSVGLAYVGAIPTFDANTTMTASGTVAAGGAGGAGGGNNAGDAGVGSQGANGTAGTQGSSSGQLQLPAM
jgi:hypothetical protein